MMALTGKNGSAMGTGNMAQGGDDGGVSVNVVDSGFVSHSTVTEEAVTTRYFYSGGTLTDIRHPDYTMHFTYDAVGPATVTYNGTAYYYLRNAQGDVTGLVNAAGQTVVQYAYDAWGNPLAATGSMAATLGEDNPLRYRGYVYDTETGLYYLKSRYYSPERGRFINADGYVSTGQGVLGSNMFAYCNSNPVAYSDVLGNYRQYCVGQTDAGSERRIGSKKAPERTRKVEQLQKNIQAKYYELGGGYAPVGAKNISTHFELGTHSRTSSEVDRERATALTWQVFYTLGLSMFDYIGDIIDFKRYDNIPKDAGEYPTIRIVIEYDLPDSNSLSGGHFVDDRTYLIASYSNHKKYLYLIQSSFYSIGP